MKQLKKGWNLIGEVGVDSGQLMICDPCYIDSGWKKTDLDLSDNKLKVVKTGKRIKVPGNWESEFSKGITYNQAMEKGLIKEIPLKETGEFSYNGCSRGTINKSYSQMDSGVGFSSGSGDGIYPVYAFVNKEGRITEVKIDMG